MPAKPEGLQFMTFPVIIRKHKQPFIHSRNIIMYGHGSSQPESRKGNTGKKDFRSTDISLPLLIKTSIFTVLLLTAGFTALHACSVFQKTCLKSLVIKKNTEILNELKKCISDRSPSHASLCTNGSASADSEILSRDEYGNMLIDGISVTGFDTATAVSQNTDIARITVKIGESVFYPEGEERYAVQLTPESDLVITDMSDNNYREHFERPVKTANTATQATDDAPSSWWKRMPYRSFASASRDEKLELLNDLPEDGNGVTALLTAELLLEKGERREAVRHYLKSADRGNGAALIRLAKLHLESDADESDVTAGIGYLKRAADHNVTEALNLLGNAYGEGRHVTQDLKKAEELFRQAADKGSAEGYYNLGRLLMYGKSSPAASDIHKACEAFRAAKNLHYEERDIYAALGDCLMYLDSDVISASRLYRKGASLNQPMSLLRTAQSLRPEQKKP